MSRADTAPTLSLPESPVYGLALGLMILLLLCVSTFALLALGWQYGEGGGNPLQKLHPGTYVAATLVLAAAALRGNPLSAVMAAGAANRLIVIYLLGVAGLLAHATLVVGLPAAGFIDTFILPVFIIFLTRDISDERRLALARLIHVFMAVNALLGVAEFVLGFRLTPLYIEGETLEEEWRASALLGHPLGNALLTGSYMILLLSGASRGLAKPLIAPALLLCSAALVAFGGRAATGLVIIAAAYIGLMGLARILSGKKFDSRTVLVSLLVLPVVAIAIALLSEGGFFEQFASRLVDDEGSASTRVAMFELFKHLEWYDLLFGPDPRFISTLMTMYGLIYGIESFWVAMIFQHGMIVAFAFFACLFCFAAELLRGTGRSGVLLIVYFFAVASTSLSLSAKSIVFGIFVLLLMILAYQPQVTVAGRRAADGPPARRGQRILAGAAPRQTVVPA